VTRIFPLKSPLPLTESPFPSSTVPVELKVHPVRVMEGVAVVVPLVASVN
jgi:hypothetical protein